MWYSSGPAVTVWSQPIVYYTLFDMLATGAEVYRPKLFSYYTAEPSCVGNKKGARLVPWIAQARIVLLPHAFIISPLPPRHQSFRPKSNSQIELRCSEKNPFHGCCAAVGTRLITFPELPPGRLDEGLREIFYQWHLLRLRYSYSSTASFIFCPPSNA